MRKINKFVAIAILAAIATFSVPQASAGIILSDRSNQATDNDGKSGTGVVMGDHTGVVMGDFTGVVMGDYVGIFLSELTGVVMGD